VLASAQFIIIIIIIILLLGLLFFFIIIIIIIIRQRNFTAGLYLRMFGEFEDAKHAQNSHEDEGAASTGALAVSLRLLHDENDEVWNDRHQVEKVHHVLDEAELGRARGDAQQELGGEPDDADGLDEEERVAVVGLLAERAAAVVRHLDAERALEGRERFRAEVGDGDEDADDGHDGENSSGDRAVRLLAEQPHRSLPAPPRQCAHLRSK